MERFSSRRCSGHRAHPWARGSLIPLCRSRSASGRADSAAAGDASTAHSHVRHATKVGPASDDAGDGEDPVVWRTVGTPPRHVLLGSPPTLVDGRASGLRPPSVVLRSAVRLAGRFPLSHWAMHRGGGEEVSGEGSWSGGCARPCPLHPWVEPRARPLAPAHPCRRGSTVTRVRCLRRIERLCGRAARVASGSQAGSRRVQE